MFGPQLFHIRKSQSCEAAKDENITDLGHSGNIDIFIFETLQFMPFEKIPFDRFQMKFILGKRIFIQPAAGK